MRGWMRQATGENTLIDLPNRRNIQFKIKY